jgi:RNA polymerase sigma-70 factor (ECF subfamily)
MTLTKGRAFVNAMVDRDRMLVDRAAQGERAALDELIRKHQARAYQYAFRLTRNPDEASDLVAEAFVRVHRSIQGFQGQSAFTTWLYRILTNCFLDARKRAARRQTTSLDDVMRTDDGEMERQIASDEEGPLDVVERGYRAETLAAAIDRLPDAYRTIVVMYHCENLSYEEISESLAVPIGTVKSRLNRARLALRDLLAGKVEALMEAC